jgi:hypothetical protein
MIDGLPRDVSKLAQRALASEYVQRLDNLSLFREREVARLHHISPKAIRTVAEAMKRDSVIFAKDREIS